MSRFLCLRLPNWPVQRFLAAQRELRETSPPPAVVLHRRDARRGEVIRACSRGAWDRGVRGGMPLAEAKVLMGGTDPWLLAEHDAAADLRWLRRLALWCERYSPLVGWETVATSRRELAGVLASPAEPTALFLDITGIGPLFGGEDRLAADLLEQLRQRRFSVLLGLASTPGAAWGATFAAAAEPASAKPVSMVPASAGPAAFASWPVGVLRIPEATLALLSQLGVDTLERLFQLPRPGLSARFGEELLVRLDQLLGQADEVVVPVRPAPDFRVEMILEHPLTDRRLVEQALRQLTARLAGDLKTAGVGALRMMCRLDVVDHPPQQFRIGFYRPAATARHLDELLSLQLERWTLPGAVGRIGLAVDLTAPLESNQLLLFDQPELQTERSLARLIERLSGRLGEKQVVQPRFLRDPLPERQVKYVPALTARKGTPSGRVRPSGRGTESPEAGQEWPNLSVEHRPVYLLSPPVLLEVRGGARAGPPGQFQYAGQWQEVIHACGPERIETGWWRGASLRRDYFRVDTAGGGRFWIFRQLPAGPWFLHGWFA